MTKIKRIKSASGLIHHCKCSTSPAHRIPRSFKVIVFKSIFHCPPFFLPEARNSTSWFILYVKLCSSCPLLSHWTRFTASAFNIHTGTTFSLLHSPVKYSLREHASDNAKKCYIHKTTPALIIQCVHELSWSAYRISSIFNTMQWTNELLICGLEARDKLAEIF